MDNSMLLLHIQHTTTLACVASVFSYVYAHGNTAAMVAGGGPRGCLFVWRLQHTWLLQHIVPYPNTISHCLYRVSVLLPLCTWKHSAYGTPTQKSKSHSVCSQGFPRGYNTVLHIQHTGRIACVGCLFPYLYCHSPQWLWRPLALRQLLPLSDHIFTAGQ